MEFQLNDDFVKENGLSEEQVKAVSGYVSTSYIPEIKKQWDGKANDNAEGIIDGAIKSIQKEFGVELPREQGEKAAEYLTRFSSTVVGSKKSELDKLKADYEEKIKGVKGNETLSKEYEAMKAEREEILKKYADYDTLKERAEKYDEAEQTLSTLKLEVAFNGVKPNFPESVNPYEAKAKWESFKKEVLANYTIEIVDNEPTAVAKDNHYKTVKLSDLLNKDASIQELMKGRQQAGTGGVQQVDMTKIDGVPFDVPKDADSSTRSKLIKEYLAGQKIDTFHPEYAKKFAELNTNILSGKNSVAA